MPVSYIEIAGVRHEVPTTDQALRVLDDDGVEMFRIEFSGLNFYLRPRSGTQLVIPSPVNLEGTVSAAGALNVGSFGDEGSLTVVGNASFSTAASGGVFMDSLPTSNPGEAGQLWSNNGVLTVSAGA